MPARKNSTILSAENVKLNSRKLLFCDQPKNPPQVILKRDGNSISSIEVRCSCGEQILLDCVYEEENITVVSPT
jgi:hypothetical protein